ncbi:hypothetical protein MRX96_041171 [Rhipicephalus microplus]
MLTRDRELVHCSSVFFFGFREVRPITGASLLGKRTGTFCSLSVLPCVHYPASPSPEAAKQADGARQVTAAGHALDGRVTQKPQTRTCQRFTALANTRVLPFLYVYVSVPEQTNASFALPSLSRSCAENFRRRALLGKLQEVDRKPIIPSQTPRAVCNRVTLNRARCSHALQSDTAARPFWSRVPAAKMTR